MKSATLLYKMYDLGVTPSHSRPRVSNDNPYSESLFRTLKYCPQWPKGGFADLEAARRWVRDFIHWYNHEHRHSRLRFVTPSVRGSPSAGLPRCVVPGSPGADARALVRLHAQLGARRSGGTQP